MSNLSRRVDKYSTEIATALGLPQNDIAKIMQKYVKSIPYEEREDLLQELTCSILESTPENLQLLYAICRNKVVDYWRKYKSRELYELSPSNDDHSNSELLVGEIEYQRIEDDLDAKGIYDSLPIDIQAIVKKRLDGLTIQGKPNEETGITEIPESHRIQPGNALTPNERQKLSRFCRKHMELLRS